MGLGPWLSSVQMRRRQLLEGGLGACPQLRHDLTSAESTKLTTAFEGFALGEGM